MTVGTSPGVALAAASGRVSVAPLAGLPALPQPGHRLERVVVTGPASQVTGQILVVLRRSYPAHGAPTRRYPVIEAFHGYPGSPDTWTGYLRLVQGLDTLGRRHELGDVIVVIPEVNNPPEADTECVDGGPTGVATETWLTRDVPGWAAQHLAVAADRGSWAALGYSEGGYCAAMAALRHPGSYGGALVLGGYFTPLFGVHDRPPAAGSPLAGAYDLVRREKAAPVPVAMWVHSSDGDSLSWRSTRAFLDQVRPPTSAVSVLPPGLGHRVSVWRAALPTALAWLGRTLPGFAPR
ncbi:MAG: esterase family protein [Micrococcales bacterium]|nr:esterase family protein [Micrococcales bacterium]